MVSRKKNNTYSKRKKQELLPKTNTALLMLSLINIKITIYLLYQKNSVSSWKSLIQYILLAGVHSPGQYVKILKVKVAGWGSLLWQVKHVHSSSSYLNCPVHTKHPPDKHPSDLGQNLRFRLKRDKFPPPPS